MKGIIVTINNSTGIVNKTVFPHECANRFGTLKNLPYICIKLNNQNNKIVETKIKIVGRIDLDEINKKENAVIAERNRVKSHDEKKSRIMKEFKISNPKHKFKKTLKIN